MSCPADSAPASIPNDIGQGEGLLELESWLIHLLEMFHPVQILMRMILRNSWACRRPAPTVYCEGVELPMAEV